MAALSIVLLVLFVIVSLLLIFLVSIQSEDNTGLGGIFGGNSDTAFGGRSNHVINKITAYLLAAFIVLAILVAFVNKSSDDSILSTQKANATTEATTTEATSTETATN